MHRRIFSISGSNPVLKSKSRTKFCNKDIELFICLLIYIIGIFILSGIFYYFLVKGYEKGQRFALMGRGNGDIVIVDLSANYNVNTLRGISFSDVSFILYKREKFGYISYRNNETLLKNGYDITKPVKIIIHGWSSHGNDAVNKLNIEAFLKVDNMNVIVVDWKSGAKVWYHFAVNNVKSVGLYVARFVDWLIDFGTPKNSFHFIGHSLGAHGAGIASRHLTRGKIPYITALDPANYLWDEKSERVKRGDAEYVEVIHTNAYYFGLGEQIGDNDFYPNKGGNALGLQPGCFLKPGCSHARAYEFFADSIDHKGYMADYCVSYKEMKKGNCNRKKRLHMGGSSPKPAFGIFYLTTYETMPYYKN